MRAVVDTNVVVTANGKSPQASLLCRQACVERLLQLKQNGKIVLDDSWLVIREYKDNLSESGQPGVGDAFLLWVLQNWKNPDATEIHTLIRDTDHPENFMVFPKDRNLVDFDRNDRKFAALAIVSGAPVWNAVDPDWWEYKTELHRNGVQVEFLCPDFIAPENK
jgi:hypothetical protein